MKSYLKEALKDKNIKLYQKVNFKALSKINKFVIQISKMIYLILLVKIIEHQHIINYQIFFGFNI